MSCLGNWKPPKLSRSVLKRIWPVLCLPACLPVCLCACVWNSEALVWFQSGPGMEVIRETGCWAHCVYSLSPFSALIHFLLLWFSLSLFLTLQRCKSCKNMQVKLESFRVTSSRCKLSNWLQTVSIRSCCLFTGAVVHLFTHVCRKNSTLCSDRPKRRSKKSCSGSGKVMT